MLSPFPRTRDLDLGVFLPRRPHPAWPLRGWDSEPRWGAPRVVVRAGQCYAAPQSTSFNDPSGEAEKEVKISHGC